MERDLHFDVTGIKARFLFCGAQGLVEFVAFELAFAGGQISQGFEVFAQTAAAHGAFLGDTVLALGQDMGFAIQGQQFDFDAGMRSMPRHL